MRILIVDDEKKTTDYLCQGLNENHYLCDRAYDGQEALWLVSENQYDLIILDVNMPKMNGFEALKKIRLNNPKLAILMLSACDEVEHRVNGLELGADDYLIKPFSFTELLARIKSLLRRSNTAIKTQYTIDNLTLDINKHQAFRDKQKLHLSPKEFLLLSLLLKRQGEVLSRTLISEKVWDIHFNRDTNIIDVAIKRLREKVDLPGMTKLIHTQRGIGYVLEKR